MYSLLWRLLPGNAWWKAVQAAVLVAGVTALLWFVVFPWLDPLLPTSDVTVAH